MIDYTSATAQTAVKAIIGEILAVFDHSPYFHIGADESGANGSAFATFINNMNTYIKSNASSGRLYMVCGPFDHGGKSQAQSRVYGFNKYVAESAYAPTTRTVPEPNSKIIGGALSSWGCNGATGFSQVRQNAPALATRLWNAAGENDYTNFSSRYTRTNAALTKLVSIASQWGVHQVLDTTGYGETSYLAPQLGGNGAGKKIAVDPSGKPWVVNVSNNLYRWTGSAWARVPGPNSTGVTDLAAGKDGSIVVTDGNGSIWKRPPQALGLPLAARARAWP